MCRRGTFLVKRISCFACNGETDLILSCASRFTNDVSHIRTRIGVPGSDIRDLPVNRRYPRIAQVSVDAREAPASEKLPD